MEKLKILKRYFGHTAFRAGQEEIIDAILAGRDAFGIMPTGGGKSLCYQVPALIMSGMTLVISPLISLMKDQVTALRNAGVNAAFINSSLSSEQITMVYRGLRAGKYKIIYVAPERLEGDNFVGLAQSLPISLVAVDEAHCISQWGQDFRPSYLKIVNFLEKLPRRPVLAAFTATATKEVRDDIERVLKLREPIRVLTGFDRPNLQYGVIRPGSKAAALRALLEQHRGQSGIVYCATRNTVEKLCAELRAAGILATRYHAGLSDGERRKNQEDFLDNSCGVMVATNAFGMGIDKPNVRFVIHYNMPKCLEAYYQEAGRAGRDGDKADCILLYSAADIQMARFFIQNGGENEDLTEEERQSVMEQDYKRLNVMVGYCNTTACLRGYILEYFGQDYDKRCGNCGNCRTNFYQKDITVESQMILSCIKRVWDKLGYHVGATLIIRVLHGSSDKRVVSLGLNGLSTHGLMKNMTRPQIREYIEILEAEGYVHTDLKHGGVELTVKAREVLFRGEKVLMATKEEQAIETQPKKKRTASGTDADNDLITALKALRYKLAREENVPLYIVFSNAALADMAAKAPESMAEFLEVSGVGKVKASRYGKVFIEEIIKYKNGKK